MDFDVLDSLEDLGYSFGDDDDTFKKVIEIGPKSLEFTKVIEWFSKELQGLLELDSYVNSIADPDDSSSFLLEVSSFLKELRCPYKSLLSGSISQRLGNAESRIILLDYLCTELQAARLIASESKQDKAFNIEIDASITATALNAALNALNIEIPDEIDPSLLFKEIEKKVKDLSSKTAGLVSKPALTETLTESQWCSLKDLYEDFFHEYSIRRELLLTRLDVTVQSFKWGESSQGKEKNILNAFANKRKNMSKSPSVLLSDVIAARESIFVIEKTSLTPKTKNTKSYTFVMPAVPDRGGRPKEQRPPVEMPSWMKRQSGGENRDFRGRGRGSGRGSHQKKRKKNEK